MRRFRDSSQARMQRPRSEALVSACASGSAVGPFADRLALAAERSIADPVAWSWAAGAGSVVGVGETAAVEREAAAPDALGEADLQALELGDARVDPA